MAEQESELSDTEFGFLCWLRQNGGSGSRTGTRWVGSIDRLINAGYVKRETDLIRTDTVHFKITDSGRRIVLEVGSGAPTIKQKMVSL